jgi:hypothetical protein
MPARDLSIRPLTVGEVIDRAVALTVRHFRPLFLAMLLVQAPALALARIQATGLTDLAASLSDPAAAAVALRRLAATSTWVLAVLVLLQLAATGVAAALVAPSLGGAPPPGRARAARAVATAALAQSLLLAAAPAAGAIPGLLVAWPADAPAARAAGLALAAAGSLALFLVAVLRLLLAPVAAAVEGLGGLRALARSSRLMAPRPGASFLERPGVRASLLLLATFLLALAVNGLAGLPRAVAARVVGGGVLGLLPGALPLGLEIALGLVEAVASAALQPFSLVAVAVFYFDRRARTEGLDLERWARGLGEAGP